MREEEGKNFGYRRGGNVAHGRASTGTGHAYLYGFLVVLAGLDMHGHATTGTGCASASGHKLKFFFVFSPHIRTITYKTN